MNPVSTARFRRSTGLGAAAIALLSMLLSGWALFASEQEVVLPVNVAFVGSGALVQFVTRDAQLGGVAFGDRLISVDGEPILKQFRRGLDFLEPGVTNVYVFQRRGGQEFEVPLTPASPSSAHHPLDVAQGVGLLLVSLFYLGMGTLVWMSKSDRAESWAFMLFCAAMSVEFATWVRVDSTVWGMTRLLANSAFVGATAFHFFTTYPIEPSWVVRHRRIRAVPYVLAAALAVALILDQIVLSSFGGLLANLSFFFGVGMCVLSLGILASERRSAHYAGVGDLADLMLVAGVVSFLPAFLLLLAEYFLQATFPPLAVLLWVVMLPTAIGIAMLRRRRFELRPFAKSSVAYGVSTLAITGLFAFMITFADQAAERLGMTMRSAQVAFLFLAILTFNPLRDRLQRVVDQVFDRDRSRYRLVVKEISEAMVSMLSLREIGDRILAAVTDTMGVERAMVLLFEEDDRVLRPSVWRGDWDEDHTATEIPSDHPIWRHLWMRREEIFRADFDEEPDVEKRESCWDVFDALEVELLVPILFGVDLLGVIAVGRKLSGEQLAGDDRQLVRTLANQSAIAMENAKAFDEIAKLNETLEARVDARTSELQDIQAQLMQSEKLSSLGQLVAGVAHELNNPIGFVHANLQLLDEFIQKLLDGETSEAEEERIRAAIGKLLVRSREGTDRVKKIVQDLRTFSRSDQGAVEDADLHDEINRTLALMEPRLKDGIEVVRDYGELPRVRCYPGQLNQVFLNLLMNACDVLVDGGRIVIETRTTPGGVRLEFADDGPGIPPDVLNRVFDPFFTTKEVGKGTGLGLSLSHGIIERHHGQIRVSSERGRGARFIIDLPLDVDEADELESDARR